MKKANYLIGAIALIALSISVWVNYKPIKSVVMKQGVTYFHENPQGLGYFTKVGNEPDYNFVVFKKRFNEANPFFDPINIQVAKDSKSAYVTISPYDHSRVSLQAYYTGTKKNQGYAMTTISFDDRLEFYTDTNGDFLPDRRHTTYRHKGAGKNKLEKITYSYEEIEQAVTPNGP